MGLIGSFMAQKVAVGTCTEKGVVALFRFFPEGEGNGAVRKPVPDFGDNPADSGIRIIGILTPLQNIGAKSQPVPLLTAGEDFLLAQSVPLDLLISPADSAVITIIPAVIGKLNQSPDIDLIPIDLPAFFIRRTQKTGIEFVALQQRRQLMIR